VRSPLLACSLNAHRPGPARTLEVISKYYARLCLQRTSWPEAEVATIANALDVAQLDRPKLDGARFHLGLIGMIQSRKRLDLALDVLEELRRQDDRYLLFVKSGMPWGHWWVWQNPAERQHYADALRRVQCSAAPRRRRVRRRWAGRRTRGGHSLPGSPGVPALAGRRGQSIYDMRWIDRGPAQMAGRDCSPP
jgi:hypothetical protein